MNERTTKIVVGVGLAAILVAAALALREVENSGAGPAGGAGADSPSQTPEDVINRLFDTAAAGDDRAYLRLVGGELRKSLQRKRQQLGAEAFRKSLRRTIDGVMGLALVRSDQAPPGCVAMDVTITFVDRNENQRMLLTMEEDRWLITSISAATMSKPPIPYGTPVFGDPPEEGGTPSAP